MDDEGKPTTSASVEVVSTDDFVILPNNHFLHMSKDEITRYIGAGFRRFSNDVHSEEWKRFRSQVYHLNRICTDIDRNNFAEVQKIHGSSEFSSDDVSRGSRDSSIFLPHLNTNHRIFKPIPGKSSGPGKGHSRINTPASFSGGV